MVVKWMMWYRKEIIDEDERDGSIANIFTKVSTIWKSSWILWYCLKFQLGFLMVERKVKTVQILMNHKIKFPWTCCKFEIDLLLTSSFENKRKTWKEIVCKFYLTNLQILPLIYQNFDFVQNHLIIYSKSKCAISLNEINHSCSWNIKFTRNKYETMLPFRS